MKLTWMLLVVLVTGLAAGVPPHIRVQASGAVPVPEHRPAWVAPCDQPDATDAETVAGFRLSVEPLGRNPRPDVDWKGISGTGRLRLLVSPGEFRNCWVAVQGLRELSGLVAGVSALSGKAGEIGKEHFMVRRNVWCLKRKEWNDAHCFLASDGPWQVVRGETLWLMVTLYAPESASGGIYRGRLWVRARGKTLELPVELAVLDSPVAALQIPFGAFISGHYHRPSQGQYVNYAPAWQVPGGLRGWMELWHSRGMTSPFLYHIYPDVSLKDGAVTVRCPFVAELQAAMTAVDMPGPLLLDMRHLSWWSHAVALDLAKRGVKELGRATSSLSGADGLSLAASGRASFHPLSREVFRLAFRAFDRAYGHGPIPVIYLAEEEIAYDGINGFKNPKTAGYEMFNPVLLAEAGRDRVCLVDNSQGWHSDRIDRGARDDLKFRSYNNWSRQALEDCRRQQAQVWYYNGGWSRTIAPYMMRIGAQAFYQWADSWGDRWLVTAMNQDGGLVTLQLERAAEGLRDLAYFRLLDSYGDRLRQAGREKLAAELTELRKAWFDSLPVKAHEYQKGPARAMTDEVLDQMRWQTVLAVSRGQSALGEKPLWVGRRIQKERGTVAGVARPIQHQSAQTGLKLHAAWEGTGALQLDGLRNEALWNGATYAKPFRWNRVTEDAMRARAASQDEFDRMDPPSGSSASVTYDDGGLVFWAGGNHMSPEHNASHGDDDGRLWSDDVFEFFWQVSPEAPEWHLIVNGRGKRTLYRNGTIVRGNAVRCAAYAPLNASGGTAMECLIPWSTMERTGKPAPGSVWRFNVCRNFNSWGQLSSWAQVEDQFGLGGGKLLFKGRGGEGNVALRVCPDILGQGKNLLAITLPLTGEAEARLLRPDGTEFLRKKLLLKDGRAELAAELRDGEPGGGWCLVVSQGEHKGRKPLWHDARGLSMSMVPETLVSGYPLRFRLHVGVGNMEPKTVAVTLQCGDDRRMVTLPVNSGDHEVCLASDGLHPGRWRIQIGEEHRWLTVMPGPF